MIRTVLPLLTLMAAVACGVVAGVFFAFSTFVMAALRRLPPRAGMAAMQMINVTADQSALHDRVVWTIVCNVPRNNALAALFTIAAMRP